MSDMRATLVALAAAFPELKVKGKKTPYLAVNGNMFAFVDDTGALCLRLSEARKAEFNASYGLGEVRQYGAVMRGYVRVPKTVLGDQNGLEALFGEVVDHAKGLRPKPTKRS